MKASHTIRPVFDDPNLVGCAGLVPALLLSRAAGLDALAEEHLQVECANPATKTTAIVAGMVAGADSIDDMDMLRQVRCLGCSPGSWPPRRSGPT